MSSQDQSGQQAYERKVEAQLEAWNKKIEELRLKAERAEAEQKAEYWRRIAEVESHRDNLKKRLEDLRGKSGQALDEVKKGVESAVSDLGESFQRAFDIMK
jgi:chromosome segregation ATPase